MIDSPSAVETLKQVTSSQVRSIPRGEETSNGFIGFRTAISRVDEDSGNLRILKKRGMNLDRTVVRVRTIACRHNLRSSATVMKW